MDRLKSRHKAALLLLLGDICAGAAPDAAMRDATVPTALPGTAAYTHVPAGFEPGQADDAALARLGFPPRPDRVRSPAAYRSWSQAVTGMQRIIPDLRKVPIQHGPMRHVFSIDNVATSSNWSGYVAAAPAYGFGRQSMVRVRGDWLLPIAQPPFGTCRLTHDGAAVYSSTWVGIDGDGSPDVLQAGTESDAVCSAGQIATYQGAWYEWYPDDEIRVSNLPVTPGSAMAVYVWANSATQGHAYLANRSAHVAVAVAFDAPGGTTLTGNSAEWIVERPYVNGAPASLTNYVQEFMGNAIAFDAAHGEYEPGVVAPPGGSPALRVQMTDAEGQVVSVPTLLGQNGIWFSDTGSALTTYR